MFGLFHSQNVDFFVHFSLSYFVLKREEQEDESEEFLELFENGISYVDGKWSLRYVWDLTFEINFQVFKETFLYMCMTVFTHGNLPKHWKNCRYWNFLSHLLHIKEKINNYHTSVSTEVNLQFFLFGVQCNSWHV